ncbi:MAG TPA: YraN family protein [Candidatus Limnocylindrales bacterium]|nr:YraN family protein [Candidatus Limnocylindrales bacterium]
MPSRHIELGQRGEQAAADYVLGLGWRVLERNWRGTRGELDIIAEDGDTLVFVEVKSRQGTPPEEAFVQVSQRKQAALIMTAEEYMETRSLIDAEWRVDVIAVVFGRGAPLLEHARDALLW